MKKISVIIAGAGGRGYTYASFAREAPERMEVIGVAEPRQEYRDKMVREFSIPKENIFSTWQEMAKKEKFADAVIIATQDSMHREPAEAFAARGYHILLEKPMAPTEEDCLAITRAFKDPSKVYAVCHVLRYTPFTKKLKEIIDSGAIGDVVSLQRLEPVGYNHQAHSFVRGNWRNEEESSFMLLAKSCHDLDWINYIMGVPCTRVSSFGSLKHFRKEEKPEGSTDNCLSCPLEKQCAYSAKRFYLNLLKSGRTGGFLGVLTQDFTEQGILKALKGPYGRCVYACDNDVVDNQVVAMEFEGGRTANFTMTAFTKMQHRMTHIFGTKGHIYGDGEIITLFDFLTEETTRYDTTAGGPDAGSGHGGGDFGLMDAFVNAVSQEDPSLVLSGPFETFASHKLVFRAEKSRKEGCVVSL
jgi:predicted dehydrogenase